MKQFTAATVLIPHLVALLVCTIGCADNQSVEGNRLTPAFGSMSGYEVIQLDLQGTGLVASDVAEVYLGANAAISLTAVNESMIQFQTHGNEMPGAVSVELIDQAGDTIRLSDTFQFMPAHSSRVVSLGAIGASLTEGIQRGVPSTRSIIGGPAARLARQMGVYFPLPLLIPEAFREMHTSDLGAPPYCNPPALDAFQQDQAIGLIDRMTTEEGRFDYALGRLSPDVQTQNFAVGGTRVRELLEGPPANDIALTFLSHLVYEPSGNISAPLARSQVEMLEELSPAVVVCFDCLGNDLIEGMINDDPFDLSGQTPIETLLSDVDALVNRLALQSADIFLATLPRPNILPFFQLKKVRLVSDGVQPEADALLSQVGQTADAVNAQLRLRAGDHANIHVVDVAALAEEWLADGVRVGDETLYIQPFGGLVGLDGLHFTDVGYALLTNAFIAEINQVMGETIPTIDVAQVRQKDRERPDMLRADGIDVDRCLMDLNNL